MRRDTAARALVFVWVALGACVASIVIQAWPNSVWAPLGDYPDQLAPVEVTGPANDPPTVTIRAKKCANETADVFGSVTWQRIEPPGHLVAGAEGQATRTVGCTDYFYRNPVPAEVWADVCEHGPSTWMIVGKETPFRPGETGEVKRWQTTPIRMVCSSAAGK